jgi:hypothetical protein
LGKAHEQNIKGSCGTYRSNGNLQVPIEICKENISMGDVAVDLGAPPADTGYEAPDIEATETDAEAGGEVQATGETSTEPGKQFRAVQNGKLDATARAAIDKLKAENPQLGKAIERALFAEDRLRRELPTGFKEVAQIRQTITDLAGDAGLDGVVSEVNGYRDFDSKLFSGDPSVLDLITEAPGGMDALAKLMPNAVERIAKANPEAFCKFAEETAERYLKVHREGYAAYIANVMLADMSRFEYAKDQFTSVPSLIERLTDAIPPENAKAAQLLQLLSAYMQRIIGIAGNRTAPPKAEAANSGADPRAAELDTREQALRRREWRSETDAQHTSVFNEEWKRLAGAVKEKDAPLVRRLYGLHLQEKLRAKADYNPNMERYFRAKDREGFLRTHMAAFKEAVPLAIRSAMAEAGIGARKAATTTGGTGTQPAKQAAAPPAGFVRVAQKPATSEVNMRLTNASMWEWKQAVLKNGKRVTWA